MRSMMMMQYALSLMTFALAIPDVFAQIRGRRNQCAGVGEQCRYSRTCCESHVCAVNGEKRHLAASEDGFCVALTDVEFCQMDGECHDHSICAVVDTKGYNVVSMCVKDQQKVRALADGRRGRGDDCMSSAVCSPNLCCQDRRAFRQPLRRICDNRSKYSRCIN